MSVLAITRRIRQEQFAADRLTHPSAWMRRRAVWLVMAAHRDSDRIAMATCEPFEE